MVKNWLVILSCNHLPPYRNKCFSTILLYYNYRQFTIGLFEKFSEPIISLFLFLMLFLNRLPVSATSYLNFYVGVLLRSFSLVTEVPLLDTETAWQLPETELQHENSKATRCLSAYLCQPQCNFNTISCKLRFYLLDRLCGFCLPFSYAIDVDIACATLSGNDNRTASFPHIPAPCSGAEAYCRLAAVLLCFVVCCDDWKNNGAVGTASAGIQAFRPVYFAGDQYTDGWFGVGSPFLLQLCFKIVSKEVDDAVCLCYTVRVK